MLKKILAVIAIICSVIFVFNIIIDSFAPLETTSLMPSKSWLNYRVNAEYPSWAFANNMWITLIVKGPANEKINLYNLGPALRATLMQNQTTLSEETISTLNFDENGETNVHIGFSCVQLGIMENTNFTVIAEIGTRTAEGRLLYYTFEGSFNISTLHAWIQPIVGAVALIAGIIDGIIFVAKRDEED